MADRVSGDGRAGATAPTTHVVSEAAVDVYDAAIADFKGRRGGLAAAFPVMLAAWIDGLTGEQIEAVLTDYFLLGNGDNERAWAGFRSALTRLGGAHE